MPLPRSKRARMRQVARWLQYAHPVAYPVTVRVQAMGPGDYGDCALYRRRFTIRLERRLRWEIMLDTLLHEYAHAMAWPRASVARHESEHSDEWALAYGRLYREFYDENGWLASQDFPAD